MESFYPVLILLIVALIVAVSIFILTNVLGPKNPTAVKLSPYECGVKPTENAHPPFKNRFYLVAVLFLLFDVEGAFFFPWALEYKQSLLAGPELFIGFLLYIGLVSLGLYYVLRKRALVGYPE